MMRAIASLVVYISVAVAVAGCSPGRLPFTYSMEIQQGTIIDPAQVERLRPGMTRRQVEFLMGSPVLTAPFSDERWDYLYTLRQDGRRVAYERVTVFFDNDLVREIERVPQGG
jgi:outer membrane protein assembly factor BamE